jgi:cytochrome P450
VSSPARPPGTRPLPVVGDLREFARDPLTFMTGLHERYGDVAAWSMGPRRQYMLFHPDDVATVLSGTNTVLRKGFSEGFPQHADLIGNNGLAMSEGDLWRRQRKIVQPGMHPKRIAGYTTTMVRYATEMVEGWRPGDVRDVHRDMVRLTQRIAVRTLFGHDTTEAEGDEVKRALEKQGRLEENEFNGLLGMLPPWVPTPNRSRLRAASQRLERLIMQAVVERRREEAGDGPSTREDDLLAMLLDARDDDGAPMAERQLRDEVHILYVAGHETTSNTLGFLWAELARRPDMAARLEEEVDRVVGGGVPEFAHVRNLVFAEALVKETLRLHPIAPMLPRKVNTTLRAGGYEFGPDTDVWVSQYVTHRDPRWWPDAEVFRPDRWLDGTADAAPRFAWFPFGGGPRVCYGQRFALAEAVLIMAVVAQRFRATLPPGQPTEVRPNTAGIISPAGGAPVALVARRAAVPA